MSSIVLPRTGILAFLDDESRQTLTTYGSLLTTNPGQILISEGIVNKHLYFILNGTFSVNTVVEDREVYFDKVGPGDCIGEVAIFHPDLASATVSSLGEGTLWSIESQQLQRYLDDWPAAGCAFLLGIATMLSRRLRCADGVIRANEIVPVFISVRAKRGMTQPLPVPGKIADERRVELT